MRIISNFKDYYDINMAYGYDPTLVYVRRTEELPTDARLISLIRKAPYYIPYPNTPSGIELDSFIIGFCGKLYPFMGYRSDIDTKGDIVKFILDRRDSLKKEVIESRVNEPVSKWTAFGSEYTFSTYAKWQEHVEDTDLSEIFIDVGAPVFKVSRVRGGEIVFEKNPRLNGFQSVKTPVEAYQEISMFLGSVLVSEKEPPVKISDDILIAKHGFDEWSFRKQSKHA